MTHTETLNESDSKILALFAEIRAALVAELPAQFEGRETSGGVLQSWNTEDWHSSLGVVRLWVTPERFGKRLSGKVMLKIDRLFLDRKTLPEKKYVIAEYGRLASDWQNQLSKAVALATKRATLAAALSAQRKERDATARTYAENLSAAIEAAALPADCFRDGELRRVTPRLVDGELRLRLTDFLYADAETAARLFAVIGGNLKVSVDASLTPEQWLAIRDIFEREYTSA